MITEQRVLGGFLQQAATATGNGTAYTVAGYDGTQLVEIVEGNTGTATVALEGSLDQTNWYAVGYQQVDNTAVPARAVTALAVAQNTKHVYQILDKYPYLRARISAVAAGTITARLYAVPV